MVETLDDAVKVLNKHKYDLADGPQDDHWVVAGSDIKRLALAQNKVMDESDALIIARGLEGELECPMCGARSAFTIDPTDGSRGYCKAEGKTWVVRPTNQEIPPIMGPLDPSASSAKFDASSPANGERWDAFTLAEKQLLQLGLWIIGERNQVDFKLMHDWRRLCDQLKKEGELTC